LTRAMVMAVMAAIVFSPAQWENWLWGWQIQWFLAVLAMVGACSALDRALEKANPWPWLAAAAAAVFVVQFSMASGVVLWPIGLGMILLHERHQRAPLALAWAVAGVLATTLFLWGYVKPQGHPSLLAALSDPGAMIRYVGWYLVGPLARSWFVGLGLAIVFLIAAGALLVSEPRRRSSMLVWIAFGAFAGGNAVLTGIGRVGFGASQGGASRYTTVGLFLLIATIPLVIYWLKALKLTWLRRGIATACTVVLLALLLRGTTQGIAAGRAWADQRMVAQFCLLTYRSTTDRCLLMLYPDAKIVRARASKLEERGWGAFASSSYASRPSLRLTDGEEMREWRVWPAFASTGWLDEIAIDSGLRAIGWAHHPAGNIGHSRQVLVVSGDRVVGRAVLDLERPDVASLFRDLDFQRSGWSAALNGWQPQSGQAPIRAYLVIDDSSLMALHGAKP